MALLPVEKALLSFRLLSHRPSGLLQGQESRFLLGKVATCSFVWKAGSIAEGSRSVLLIQH